MHVFKVPSLRNVAKTSPYFHNGSVERLEDAIQTMAQLQLGRTIPNQDVTSIKTFLESLSGDYL
jgi:cytochrome c peroxidase